MIWMSFAQHRDSNIDWWVYRRLPWDLADKTDVYALNQMLPHFVVLLYHSKHHSQWCERLISWGCDKWNPLISSRLSDYFPNPFSISCLQKQCHDNFRHSFFCFFFILIFPLHILAFDSSSLNCHQRSTGNFCGAACIFTIMIKPTFSPFCCGCVIHVKGKFRKGNWRKSAKYKDKEERIQAIKDKIFVTASKMILGPKRQYKWSLRMLSLT